MKYFKALAAVAAGYSLTAVAQTERDLDSHVHGAAAMNVAVADSAVFIEPVSYTHLTLPTICSV